MSTGPQGLSEYQIISCPVKPWPPPILPILDIEKKNFCEKREADLEEYGSQVWRSMGGRFGGVWKAGAAEIKLNLISSFLQSPGQPV